MPGAPPSSVLYSGSSSGTHFDQFLVAVHTIRRIVASAGGPSSCDESVHGGWGVAIAGLLVTPFHAAIYDSGRDVSCRRSCHSEHRVDSWRIDVCLFRHTSPQGCREHELATSIAMINTRGSTRNVPCRLLPPSKWSSRSTAFPYVVIAQGISGSINELQPCKVNIKRVAARPPPQPIHRKTTLYLTTQLCLCVIARAKVTRSRTACPIVV